MEYDNMSIEVYKMEKFDAMSDVFNANYSRVETAINNTYEQLKANPDNEPLRAALFEICEVAQSIVNSQLDFTEMYCEDVSKDVIIDRLTEKYNNISTLINNDIDISNRTR